MAGIFAFQLNLNPPAPPAPVANPFFGINLHFGSSYSAYSQLTPEQYVARLKAMGMGVVRTNISSAAKAAAVLPYITACTKEGIAVVVVIDQAPDLRTVTDYNNAKAAGYTGTLADWTAIQLADQKSKGATLGDAIARALVGSGVKRIECTNEIDFKCKFDNNPQRNPRGFIADGASVDDFDSLKFECWRAWLSGMVPAVQAQGFSASYASGTAFPQVAFDMIRRGMDVTGAITKAPVPLDNWIGAHFYATQGNPTNFTAKSRTGIAQAVNTLAELAALTPKPEIYVTEWGIRDTDSAQATHVGTRLAEYWGWKDQYGVTAAILYCLFADPSDSGTGTTFGVAANNFGVIQADGATEKPAYGVLRSFACARMV
jgi:hypothetical protein